MIKGAFTLVMVVAIFALRAVPAASVTLARVGVPESIRELFPGDRRVEKGVLRSRKRAVGIHHDATVDRAGGAQQR